MNRKFKRASAAFIRNRNI